MFFKCSLFIVICECISLFLSAYVFLLLNLCLLLLLICSISFVTPLLLDLLYVHCLVHQSVAVFRFVYRSRSAIQLFVFVNFSNVLQVFLMYLNLRVYLLVFVGLFFCCYVVTSLYLPLCRSSFTVFCFNLSDVWLVLISLLVFICFCES